MNFISHYKGLRVLFYSLVLAALPTTALARAHASPIGSIFFQQAIKGTVSDASGPLPGVIISVRGTPLSTISDAGGKFSIAATSGDVLVFSFTGFKTVEVAVGTQSTVNVTLKEDVAQLGGLTINAGYYSVKKKESTGSIASITAKDIETQPVTNALATMQGRMAGVEIVQASGVSGGSFDIRIRGQNSIRTDGNSPLYIIDGVPYASETTGYSRSNVVQPYTASPLNSFNPSEIESIEVLKDADATAIYGSRGANGVVLITTKKGRAGKTRYNAGATTGFGRVTRFADLMDTSQYLAMRSEAFANDGTQPGEGDYDVNGTWDPNRYTDWQKELLGGTMEYTDLQASASGGSENSQFMATAGVRKETTVFPGDFGYSKANVRLNINHTSDDKKFNMNLSAGYTAQKNDQPGVDLTSTALTLAPNAPKLYNPDGSLNYEGSTWDNPLGALEGKQRSTTRDLLANGVLSYELTTGLTAKASIGYTDTRYQETRTQPSTMFDPVYELTSDFSTMVMTTTARQSWIIEPQLIWNHTLGRGVIEALAGATFQERSGRTISQEVAGFSSNALIYNLASARIIAVLQDSDLHYRYQAFFGRINYNWNKKYIINLTGRRDGSSRFGPGKQYAAFGAVGAAWLFSNEGFWGENSVVSFGKLRGSYGSSGNDQIGDYQYMDTYGATGANYGGTIGLGPNRLLNPDFSWETNRKLEAALELGFLRDRIMLTVAGYRNRSSSQLVGIPLPATTGFSSVQANLKAEVENRGVEFSLNTVNIEKENFSWRTDFNIAFSRNELLSFPDLDGSTYRNQLMVGQALNIRKVYQCTGVDPQTGLYTFRDFNGDGQITAAEDRRAVVDLNPDFFGGLTNHLKYKNWQLDFLFQFVRQRNYAADYNSGLPGTMANQPESVLNRWQESGDKAAFQRFSAGSDPGVLSAYDRYIGSDAILDDASFIRLKNIALSYTLPGKFLKGVGCRLHIEAQNLLTFTAYEGADPEFRFSGYLPPLRVISGGVNLTF
ncbi:TonB-dependent receptor [Flavobacterium sp. NRK1]|uniref:SusC/RagA family TonB-linked outer membrane protein n=1 Tax=Flavobacterium sp. NRK1 TaxID=2954929 RepID=UPI002092CC6D|nr:TonB-dependent receptor [Flavobacterium sp. NRK1]MCO6148961.1 TonB-dependent receptor [Flavobacterium sp. NRK1]